MKVVQASLASCWQQDLEGFGLMLSLLHPSVISDHADLASWVPDLVSGAGLHARKRAGLLRYAKYRASEAPTRSPSTPYLLNETTLNMKGVIVTKVSELADIGLPSLELPEYSPESVVKMGNTVYFPGLSMELVRSLGNPSLPSLDRRYYESSLPYLQDSFSKAITWLRQLLKFCADTAVPTEDDEEIWRTIGGDLRLGQKVPRGDGYKAPPWKGLLDAEPDLADPKNWSSANPTLSALSFAELDELLSFLGDSGFLPGGTGWADFHLFRSHDGRLGWAPPNAQVNDVVCVLSSAWVPHILRPHGDKYRVIGIAYLDGIMDGEAFPEDSNDLIDIDLI